MPVLDAEQGRSGAAGSVRPRCEHGKNCSAPPRRRSAPPAPPYTSVYLYMLHGDELVLEAFAGRETDHTRIPVGTGVCGTAVATGLDQNVPDVTRGRELPRVQHLDPFRAGGADPAREPDPGPDRHR